MSNKLIGVLIIAATLLSGCNNGEEINGRSVRSMYKSVVFIKNHLPADQRVEFEVAFWTLRNAIKDEDDLLDKVSGKTPEELIELAKEVYQERKNAGAKEYAEFNTWEQMIAKFSQERIEQNKRKKPDPRDQANNVLYKL
ncbi:MAG: hypothetical protein RL637_160 [Pseudomonadota bacterium]|jgi:hypothetical protein